MEFNGLKADIVFTIKAVESIPCDIKGQVMAFDIDKKLISDSIVTPWPMPWIQQEITKLVSSESSMPQEDRFRVYNPEEPDQYVVVEVQRTKY